MLIKKMVKYIKNNNNDNKFFNYDSPLVIKNGLTYERFVDVNFKKLDEKAKKFISTLPKEKIHDIKFICNGKLDNEVIVIYERT